MPANRPARDDAKEAITVAIFGHDISSNQPAGTVAARPNATFFIVKATEGRTFVDPLHGQHTAQARAAHKLVGHYHFARPDNNGAVAEADHFLASVGARAGEVLALDFEPRDLPKQTDPATWPAWVTAFLTRVNAKTGGPCWLYANNDILSTLIARSTSAQRATLRTHPLWKAAFNPTIGSIHGWPVVTAWQFTTHGNTIDENKFFGDAVTWSKLSVPQQAVA